MTTATLRTITQTIGQKAIKISKNHNNNFLQRKDHVKHIYTQLIEKVVNAKYGEECGIFIANNTVRGGKLKENNFAFRGSIDAMSSRGKKEKDKKRKKKSYENRSSKKQNVDGKEIR